MLASARRSACAALIPPSQLLVQGTVWIRAMSLGWLTLPAAASTRATGRRRSAPRGISSSVKVTEYIRAIPSQVKSEENQVRVVVVHPAAKEPSLANVAS